MSAQKLLLLAATPPDALEALRWVEAACARVGLSVERTWQLSAAAVEALNNSLEHAYGDVPGDVEVELLADEDGVVVTVTDFGAGLAAASLTTPDATAERGRGLWMMRQCCDQVVIASDGRAQRVILRQNRRHGRTSQPA